MTSFARAVLALAALLPLPAAAQEVSAADATLLGMRLGRDTLQEVIMHLGNAPLVQPGGDAPDELCYAAESPLEQTWVVFAAGPAGQWERLTEFRVLSEPPDDRTCRRIPDITASLATASGIRKGLAPAAIPRRPGVSISVRDGRVAAFEVALPPLER